MARVVHFEISADDPDSAINFYKTVFGWTFEKWKGPFDYWMVMTGKKGEPGIDGGLMKRQDQKDSVKNTIGVPSVDKYIEKIKKNGGTVLTPKASIPGVGYMAYFRDPEGNVFGIMESDTKAR